MVVAAGLEQHLRPREHRQEDARRVQATPGDQRQGEWRRRRQRRWGRRRGCDGTAGGEHSQDVSNESVNGIGCGTPQPCGIRRRRDTPTIAHISGQFEWPVETHRFPTRSSPSLSHTGPAGPFRDSDGADAAETFTLKFAVARGMATDCPELKGLLLWSSRPPPESFLLTFFAE